MDREQCVSAWLARQVVAVFRAKRDGLLETMTAALARSATIRRKVAEGLDADLDGYETAVDVAAVFLSTLGDAPPTDEQVRIVKTNLGGLDVSSQVDLGALLPQVAAIFFTDLSHATRVFEALDWPEPFPLMLANELERIGNLRKARGGEADIRGTTSASPYRKAASMELTGLAFSGGGIRSATFNLGVLQRLSEHGLLGNIDYLSTVSGGGYIGSWFTAWVHRQKSFADVVQRLSPTRFRDPGAPALEPIRFLRRFSNYLTPELGAFSFDTWAMVSVYLRNVSLNLTLLVALFGSLLLVPRLLGHFLLWFTNDAQRRSAALGVGIFLVLVAVAVIGVNLKKVTEKPDGAAPERTIRDLYSSRGVQLWAVATLLLGSFLIFLWTWSRIEWLQTVDSFLDTRVLVPMALVVLASYVLWPPLINRTRDEVPSDDTHETVRQYAVLVLVIAVTCGVSAIVGGALWYGFIEVLVWMRTLDGGDWHALVWGPPLLVSIVALIALLQVGLMGSAFPDSGREWLSRYRGVLNIYSMAWVGLFAISIYGAVALAKLGLWAGGAIGAGWVGTTIATFLAGRRPPDPAGQKSTSTGWNVLTAIGPPIFVIGFLWVISIGEHLLLAHATLAPLVPVKGFLTSIETNHWFVLNRSVTDGDGWALAASLCLGVTTAAAALLLAWRIDINEFSMHNFYKNRLTRCYLGASNRERTPNSFSGFDESDDLPLSACAAPHLGGPYPIINATLNLTTGQDLAWQERKAASFVFTPLYCGYDLQLATGHNPKTGPGRPAGALARKLRTNFDPLRRCAYRRTKKYAFKDGIRMGTAVAISGAAADPNQGYNTAPALAFLMTVFNVRLGWWLGNPRRDFRSKLSGPVFGLAALVSELMGSTDDASNFVRLSDGGHFDNMGLYELVRRRCRFIILCDAEQDPAFQFGGLGMAIRKCRVDFGAEISIDPASIAAAPATRRSVEHCAMGEILYADGSKGALLYIKPSLTGDEPEDLLQYSAEHADFPHETTADQWFAESQFESYRKLGYHAAHQAIEPARMWGQVRSTAVSAADPRRGIDDEGDVSQLFAELAQHWSPVNPNLRPHATQHTATLVELLQHIGATPGLQQLGAKLFPGAPQPFGAGQGPRDAMQEFYFCMRIIQLVEDIYHDFKLDEKRWKDDPRIGGWRQLFRNWKAVPEMQSAWDSQKDTFRADFQVYFDRLDED